MRNLIILLLTVLAFNSNAQTINFNDYNLKQALLEHDPLVDLNEDGEISIEEAEAFEGELVLKYNDISSCDELNHFIGVQSINIRGNDLIEVTLSGLPNLSSFNGSVNDLETISITNCDSFEVLNLQGNSFTSLQNIQVDKIISLDISNNYFVSYNFSGFSTLEDLTLEQYSSQVIDLLDLKPLTNLKYLNCYSKINNIDVSTNENLININIRNCDINNLYLLQNTPLNHLIYLNISGNNITSLGQVSMPALEKLVCYNNPIEELNLSPCENLIYLNANNCNLSSLDISACPNLKTLYVRSNNINEIHLTENKKISKLIISGNNINELDISQNTLLKYLKCNSSNLTELNLENNTLIETLDCSENMLTELDLVTLSNLSNLTCSNNQLAKLDLYNCPSLMQLWANNNNIDSIGFHYHNRLSHIFIEDNPLTHINFEENHSIAYLSLKNSLTTELDLHNLHHLSGLEIIDLDNLEYINLKNGNNHNLYALELPFQGVNNLQSICVDDLGSETVDQYQSITNQELTFSDDCNEQEIEYNILKAECNWRFYNIPPPPINGLIIAAKNLNNNETITKVDGFGDEHFKLDQGSYTLELISDLPDHYDSSPRYDTVELDLDSNILVPNQLYISREGDHVSDMSVQLFNIDKPVPGELWTVKVCLQNMGTQSHRGDISLNFNPDHLSLYTFELVDDMNEILASENQIKVLSNKDLVPMKRFFYEFTFRVNENLMAEDKINLSTSLIEIDDAVSTNNQDQLEFEVKEAIALNYITFSEELENLSESDSTLHYTIHFTNTSQDTLDNLTITNLLPEEFRFESYRLISTSHYCDININENQEFEYNFPNLYLFPESINHLASKLSISYTVKVDQSKSPKLEFDNIAKAYTNGELIRTLYTNAFDVTKIPEKTNNQAHVELYPNPASSTVRVKTSEDIKSIAIYSTSGILLKRFANKTLVDISDLKNGLYLVQVVLENGEMTHYELIIKN